MEEGPVCNMNKLNHPYSQEDVEGDWGTTTLDSYTANPSPPSKTHPADEPGDVRTGEYNSHSMINHLMVYS